MKRRKEPTEFRLGTIIVPYIEMFDDAVAIRIEGVQLIIDTYFNDLSIGGYSTAICVHLGLARQRLQIHRHKSPL